MRQINSNFVKRVPGLLAALIASSLITSSSFAAPQTLGYQGRLLDGAGAAINGQLSLSFALYDGEDTSVANRLWTEDQTLGLTDGFYATQLGAVTPIDPAVLDTPTLWLSITVAGEQLLPLQKIGSVAYALNAQSADSAKIADSATTATNLSGGSVDAADLSVNGISLLDASGKLDLSQGGAIPGCAIGELLTWDGNSWGCAAASVPLVGGAAINLSNGIISLGACPNDGEVWKRAGGAWTCLPDADTLVSWSTLAGIPAGFTDGVDNVGGDMTGVSAGAGLTGGGLSGDVSLAVNFGGNGASTQVARADHDHGPILTAAQLSLGLTPSNAGRSCLDIKTRAPWATDGPYLVDPDGTGPNAPFRVLCDMTRDGGGWTLILKNRYQSGIQGMAGSFGNINNLQYHQSDFYKLADTSINAVIGDGTFDILADQVGFNPVYSTGNHEYVIVRNYTATFSFTSLVPESSTPTVFESYRAADDMLNWRGRLQCGNVGAAGINCFNVLTVSNPVGTLNPQGGAGCLVPLGKNTDVGWHHFYMGDTNADTYLYICNGAQHSSSYDLSHRWWVR